MGGDKHQSVTHSKPEECPVPAVVASPVPGADDLQAVFQALLSAAERRQLDWPSSVGSRIVERCLLLLLPGHRAAAHPVPAQHHFPTGG